MGPSHCDEHRTHGSWWGCFLGVQIFPLSVLEPRFQSDSTSSARKQVRALDVAWHLSSTTTHRKHCAIWTGGITSSESVEFNCTQTIPNRNSRAGCQTCTTLTTVCPSTLDRISNPHTKKIPTKPTHLQLLYHNHPKHPSRHAEQGRTTSSRSKTQRC